MSLLDQLRQMYGQDDPNEDPVQALIRAPEPYQPPPQLDPATLSATTADMSQPTDYQPAPANDGGAGGGLAHPDVLGFLKQLDQSGRLTAGNDQPKAPKGTGLASQTVKSEEGGIPDDVRAQGVAVRGQNQLDNGMIDVQRMHEQADELEKRAAMLRQDAQVQAMQRQDQEKELAAKQERLRAQQASLAAQSDEPINAHRYFDNMGIASKALAVISAAAYGYLGGQGQPPVMDSLMQMAKEDTRAQMENNAAAQGKRSAIMAQYEREYGDTTLVAKRLEADKLLEMSKMAQSEAMNAKSVEAKAAAEDMKAKLQNQVGVIHQDIQEATFGKPLEVSTTFNALKPKGGADPAAQLAKAAKLNQTLAEGGVTDPAERAAMLKAVGLQPIEGRTMAEQKMLADQSEAERKRTELTPEQKTDARKRVDGLADMVQGMSELDNAVGFKRGSDGSVTNADDKKLDSSIRGATGQAAQSFSNALPFGINKGAGELLEKLQPEDSKALDRARDKIVFGKAQAQGQGALAGPDVERYRKLLPTDSPLSLQRASSEMWRERKQQYNNLVGQYGKDAVDEMLRKRGIDPAELSGG